ncbi:MAG: polysaccharide biosynthesis C-terminal domain-containing protein, partial [Candidatus Omnitrophica bacterium]|nr:polysaccharide biosynthesis C-terminal domain-containing protein [Candidatus Omnitrophota bacterium]
GKLMVPRIVSSSIYQLNNFVDSIFGSLATIVGEGGVAVLYFSYRLVLFPIGIFSNALTQAILPTLSTQALEEDHAKLKQTLSWGLRASFFLLLPASVGFMVLALPIISALFGGGKFDLVSVGLTANALFFYSIGLFAYGSTKIVQSCFFALKDTLTPTKIAALTLAMNIVLNSLLMFPLKIGGIALANSISGIITFFILFSILKKRLGGFKGEEIFISFLRILAASLWMGVACITLNKAFNFIFALIGGILSYIIFCFIFRVPEMRQLWRWLAKRYA